MQLAYADAADGRLAPVHGRAGQARTPPGTGDRYEFIHLGRYISVDFLQSAGISSGASPSTFFCIAIRAPAPRHSAWVGGGVGASLFLRAATHTPSMAGCGCMAGRALQPGRTFLQAL